MLEIQKFLLNHSLEDLKTEYAIDASFSRKNPNKFSLNYDQRFSKDGLKIVEEARGLILATSQPITLESQIVGRSDVVACPFFRFYNLGDPSAAKIDLTNASMYVKLDGTLAIVYFDEQLNQWCVGTRSVPDADLKFDSEKTFRDLFEVALEEMGLPNFQNWAKMLLSKQVTYMFELCTPENEQVVKHKKYSVTLLGARDKETLKEIPIEYFEIWKRELLPICEKIPLSDFESCLKWVNDQPPNQNEGLVVCDINFNRVKIKSEAYKTAHKLKDKTSNSPRAILEMILLKKEDDIRDLLSDRNKKILNDLKEGLRILVHNLDFEYHLNFSENRKDFAIAIKMGSGLLGPQMWCWQNKKHASEWFDAQIKNNSIPDSVLDSILEMIKKQKDKNV